MTTDVLSILDDIEIGEYEKTGIQPITHTFEYRSQFGYLEGIKANTDNQKLIVVLSAGQPQGNFKEIQLLLGAILERHATFGPLYQYPKTFVIGPNAFDSNTFKPRAGVNLPYTRDIDRIVWIKKALGDTKYAWGVIDLFHNYRSALQVVRTEAKNYVNYSAGEVTQGLVQSILRGVFRDAENFEFDISHSKARRVVDVDHFEILWMLQKLTMERSPDYSTILRDIRSGNSGVMKKLALLGTIPYVEPVNRNQSEHPVSIGALKFERLAAISDLINRPPQIASQSKPLIDLADDTNDVGNDTGVFSSSDDPQSSSEDFQDWDDWN